MNDDVGIVDEGEEISLIVRTADQTRKAEITVPTDTSFGDIISDLFPLFVFVFVGLFTPSPNIILLTISGVKFGIKRNVSPSARCGNWYWIFGCNFID